MPAIGIPAEGLGLGILQPEIGILQPDWYSSDSWGIGFPEGYFSAETFHNAYPSAGMPMGRAFCGIERSEGKYKAFRHVDAWKKQQVKF